MKKLTVAIIILINFQIYAQKDTQKARDTFYSDLTVEQIADLKTKKMTLQLGLTKNQQDKIYALNLDLVKNKKSKSEKLDRNYKPTSTEKYHRIMERLDRKIATKTTIKSILDQKQFKKWEKTQIHKMHKRKKTLKRVK
jgi:hypothetical protein